MGPGPTPTCWSGWAPTPPEWAGLYIKDLEDVDLNVLETIVARSYGTVTDGTYTLRAHEGGHKK